MIYVIKPSDDFYIENPDDFYMKMLWLPRLKWLKTFLVKRADLLTYIEVENCKNQKPEVDSI